MTITGDDNKAAVAHPKLTPVYFAVMTDPSTIPNLRVLIDHSAADLRPPTDADSRRRTLDLGWRFYMSTS